MRNWGIQARILWLVLLPLGMLALCLSWYFTASRLSDLDQALEERGLGIVRQLAPICEYGLFSGNLDYLRTQANNARRDPLVTAVVVVDNQGVELVREGRWEQLNSMPELQRLQQPTVVAANEMLLELSSPVMRTDAAVTDLFSLQASHNGSQKPIGYVAIQLSRESTIARQTEVWTNSLYITFTAVLLALVLALRMGRDITSPVRKLTAVVNAIALGKLGSRVSGEAGGEFGMLKDGINHMAEALELSHQNLQDKIAAATARLSWQATHDALTGLVNRAEFESRVERALLSAKQYDRIHALIFMDLDQFKIVNDSCGHAAGDELLRQISKVLHQHMRDRDTLARIGGDEFGVLLENCPIDMAIRLAEALKHSVQEFRFPWEDRVFKLGISIGLVQMDKNSVDVGHLLSAADAACYQAKDGGRNRIHIYQMQDGELREKRNELLWVSRLSDAIEHNRLHLYYQCIEQLQSGQKDRQHLEILLRYEDDGGEHLLPRHFIPAAERYQLMPAIDKWVVDKTLNYCQEFLQKDPEGVLIAINLSGSSLSSDEFLAFLQQRIAGLGKAARSICFEITETAAISNMGRVMAVISNLRQQGCQFALDDFGSGLSSLNYLKKLPVDFLKIDGTFVKDMASDPLDAAMVESIQTISSKMGLKTIAEFVENPLTLERLRHLGVDYAQGNWIHQPAPLVELCKT
jgi:diguanylate cyclase (GGDEF)-like protein